MPILKKIILLILIAGVFVFSFQRSQKENSGGDFHVFWKSGVNLLEGKSLYQPGPGEREFLYPPFAALFFIPFSILPFNVAAFIFYFLNFFLWAASFYLIYKIFILYYDDRLLIRYGLIFSFLISFKLFWNNIMMVQSNEIIFFICLLGIFSFLKKRENWAIFLFALATSVKVWPLLFFFWVLLRGKKYSFFKSLGWGILLTSAPFLFGRGLDNLETFFRVISKLSIQGKTEITYANQAIGATIFRLFTTYPPEIGKYAYTIWDLGVDNADLLFKISSLGIFLLMVITLISAKIIKNKNKLIEPSLIFLVGHLLSGHCFKAHLVTLSFIFMTIFIITFSRAKGSLIIWGKILMLFGFLLIFTGKEFIGEKGQYLTGGWGFWTWLMVLSFGFLISSQIFDAKPKKLIGKN